MNKGLFKPTVMFFGLSNSPATFQAFMNDILSDFIDEGWCVVYMDDILIFSENPEDHQERTERLMQRIQRHDLYLKPEKCEFDVKEVIFLGMVIRSGHIAMDPIKLVGIAEWEALRTVKRKFLSEPILVMLNVDKLFVIEADTSKWATGAVLRQQGTDDERHPYGYLLKSLSQMEQNYKIYNQELLAIVQALAEWRHYLMGGKHRVVILSKHKNLTYFWTAQKLNRRQARWSLFLSELDLVLVHMPGKSMMQANALSRRSNEQDNEEDNNNNVVLLPEWLFVQGINFKLGKEIRERLGPDDFHKSALELLLHQSVPPIKSALSLCTRCSFNMVF
uniref:Putative reverse transcriptase-rnase h-integrase n=1 Tax=Moniliophthora roreri TaxID=221103 RepID=A0A0W0FTM6_MONRR